MLIFIRQTYGGFMSSPPWRDLPVKGYCRFNINDACKVGEREKGFALRDISCELFWNMGVKL
jgi:hypothetical protein